MQLAGLLVAKASTADMPSVDVCAAWERFAENYTPPEIRDKLSAFTVQKGKRNRYNMKKDAPLVRRVLFIFMQIHFLF